MALGPNSKVISRRVKIFGEILTFFLGSSNLKTIGSRTIVVFMQKSLLIYTERILRFSLL